MPRVPTVRPNGPLIKKLREDRFYSGVMFARKIGCHSKALYRIENSEPPTGIDFMRRIAAGLDIDVSVIVRRELTAELTVPCPHCGEDIDVYDLYVKTVLAQNGGDAEPQASAA